MKNVVHQHMNINDTMSQIELNKAIIQRYFAEYIAVLQRNVFKIPDGMDWDLPASLPVTGLTPFHALNEAGLTLNEFLLVFGASGNPGMIARQLGKKMGAKVIAISEEEWVRDFGADYVIAEYDRVVEQVREITSGKMADVVIHSLGVNTWNSSFESIGINGRLVTFGGLTSADVKLNVQALYSRQIKLIGSAGGTRRELKELIDNHDKLQINAWKRFDLDNIQQAFAMYQHPLGYEIRDLTITVGDDLAFEHCLNRISGTLKNRNRTDFWLRSTTCLRKIDGSWLIAHD